MMRHYFINLTDVGAADGHSLYNISYDWVMPFERNFVARPWVTWFAEHWGHVFWMVGLYMVVIFGIQAWMETRPRFDLRYQLFVWNVCLAIFSLWGAVRSIEELYYVLKYFGLYPSYCLCGYRWVFYNFYSNL